MQSTISLKTQGFALIDFPKYDIIDPPINPNLTSGIDGVLLVVLTLLYAPFLRFTYTHTPFVYYFINLKLLFLFSLTKKKDAFSSPLTLGKRPFSCLLVSIRLNAPAVTP